MADDAESEDSSVAVRKVASGESIFNKEGVARKDDAGYCSAMNAFQSMFSCGSPQVYNKGKLRDIDECDYDTNPTRLYKAIEKLAWTSVLDFILEGTWQDTGFEKLFPETDANPPAKQAAMWVTKFNARGTVEWSRIPLHAAMIYGAPYSIVKRIVDLFPEGIRCTDDKGMLPLHLAIKHSSTAKVLRLLLEKFPEAMFAKDNEDNSPLQMKEDDRSKIMSIITTYTTKKVQEECGQIEERRIEVLRKDVSKLTELNKGLEAKLISKNQSTILQEHLLNQLATLRTGNDVPVDNIYGNILGHDMEQRVRKNHYHGRKETPQMQNGMSETSAIHRLDRELRAEKQRLEEKSRLNRELRNEKQKLEEDLQRSKQQVRKLTKQCMKDDLKYCQLKMNELNHEAAATGFNNRHGMEDAGQRREPTGFQEREDVEDFREEDDLERRIRQSQATVSRLLQRTTRRGTRSRSSRDQFRRRGGKFGHGRHSQNSDDVSEMTTPSFGGRSTEDVLGDLHKLMKHDLKQKETGIRDQISRMRHCYYDL